MKKVVVLLLSVVSLCRLIAADDVRFIELGWDFLTSDSIAANIRAVENSPMDGAGIQIIGINEKRESYYLTWLHLNTFKPFEHFQPAVVRLRALNSPAVANSFVQVGINPGRIDIFDDAAWETVAQNYRTAARVAKAAGMRGIILDPEAYVAGANQFSYSHQPERRRHTYAEYLVKARERGRAVMQAVAAEFPDMDLLILYMYCFNYRDHRPGAESRNTLNSFTAAFFDGMIEAAPATMKIFDGQETSYDYNSPLDFANGKNLSIQGVLPYVAPDVRDKYRGMVRYAPAIYLDRYLPSELFDSPHDLKGMSSAVRLLVNLMAARRVSDGYIWVYNERYRWWPTHVKSVQRQYWHEVIPGCDTAFNIARNPETFAHELLHSGKMVSVSNLIADWKQYTVFNSPSWQDKDAVSVKNNTLVIRKAWGKAGAKYTFTVRPGDIFMVAASVSIHGLGYPAIRIIFKKGQNPLYTVSGNDELVTRVINDRLASMVVVPDDADSMEIIFAGEAQDINSATGQICFNNLEVKRFSL